MKNQHLTFEEKVNDLKRLLPKKINRQWIKEQAINNMFILGEDNSKVVSRCETFAKLRTKNKIKQPLHEINYHQMGDIIEDVTGVKLIPKIESLSEIEKNGVVQHMENEQYISFKITTPHALSKLSDSTDWCVRHIETAESYFNENSFFYIVYKKKTDGSLIKFALSDQYAQMVKDIKDRDFGEKVLNSLNGVLEPCLEDYGLTLVEEYKGMKIIKITKEPEAFKKYFQKDAKLFFYVKDSFHDQNYAQESWGTVEEVREQIDTNS